MVEKNMSKENMAEIKEFIRAVGEELAGTVATTKMEAIAQAHVQAEFKALGVDPSTVEGVRSFQANMATLYRLRKVSEKIGLAIILTFFTVLTGGVISVIWQSIKSTKGAG